MLMPEIKQAWWDANPDKRAGLDFTKIILYRVMNDVIVSVLSDTGAQIIDTFGIHEIGITFGNGGRSSGAGK